MRCIDLKNIQKEKSSLINDFKKCRCQSATFGDDMLVWGKDSDLDAAIQKVSRFGAVSSKPVKAGTELYLVVQKGNLFQRLNPQCSVLFDRGRHIIVALSEEERKMIREDIAVFGIEKLKPGQPVVDRIKRRSEEFRRTDWINALVGAVDQTQYDAVLTQLVSYYSRNSVHDAYDEAADWCKAHLSGFGYAVSEQTITVSGTTSRNIIADKGGQGSGSKKLAIVCSHLDSINASGGPTAPAPGADDNGSGCAALLEIARVVKDIPCVHDLRLILFAGEEQGMNGSAQYVDALPAADRSRINAVVNMDMIGVMNTAAATVLIEGAAASQTVIDGLVEAALAYTSLTVDTSLSPYASDHVSFINAALPAVLVIEGNDSANTHVHTNEDTIDRIDPSLALEITRLCAGYVASRIQRKEDIMTGLNIKDILVTAELSEFVKDHYSKLFLKQWSGRYCLENTASILKSVNTALEKEMTLAKFYADPVYHLDKPVVSVDHSSIALLKPRLYITLHIDIDGNDPLQVVSGTLLKTNRILFMSVKKHFIGQVTSNKRLPATLASRSLVVENFTFDWPNTSNTIDRLEITLENIIDPQATIMFFTSDGAKHYGPYVLERDSRYFRELEIEVDKEDAAQEFEPFNTHLHPERPADLPEKNLTMAAAYTQAGLLTQYSANNNVINTTAAGLNGWSDLELHDLMQTHWSAFANKPQWKMWFFAAESHENSGLAGSMFDGYIDEPGGVDRQGTALFTHAHYLFDETGSYSIENPPEAESVKRELFFTAVHEAGHAFNLFHPWQKTNSTPWSPPDWADPMVNDARLITWMSYPETADPSPGFAAQWFYERFYYKFDASELLFLRHAPEQYVQMGNEAWGINHGRAYAANLEKRLELTLRARRPRFEFGEPLFLELRLKNICKTPLPVMSALDPRHGFVSMAVTGPDGKKKPFLPPVHADMRGGIVSLEPNTAIYESVNVTAGKCGFHFKQRGAYRIEACYTNIDGKQAAAQMQVWINPPSQDEDVRIIAELYDAKIASTLYYNGSRYLEAANDKIDWVCKKLPSKHPAQYHLNACRALPFARSFKTITDSRQVRLLDPDPGIVMERLEPVVGRLDQAADSLGHIASRKVIDAFAEAALQSRKKAAARMAKTDLVNLFKKRGVVARVVTEMEKEIKAMK